MATRACTNGDAQPADGAAPAAPTSTAQGESVRSGSVGWVGFGVCRYWMTVIVKAWIPRTSFESAATHWKSCGFRAHVSQTAHCFLAHVLMVPFHVPVSPRSVREISTKVGVDSALRNMVVKGGSQRQNMFMGVDHDHAVVCLSMVLININPHERDLAL